MLIFLAAVLLHCHHGEGLRFGSRCRIAFLS
jgi:hypothetical protein